jgi:DNA-binding response OmpR family regulator
MAREGGLPLMNVVVDDSPTIRKFVTHALIDAGYEVLEAI